MPVESHTNAMNLTIFKQYLPPAYKACCLKFHTCKLIDARQTCRSHFSGGYGAISSALPATRE